METEAPKLESKPKRKYRRRSQAALVLGGKTYRGLSVEKEGKFLTLITATGKVVVNTDLVPVVEIRGEVVRTPKEVATVALTTPNVSGGMAEARFRASRDRQLEGLMAMPGGVDVQG